MQQGPLVPSPNKGRYAIQVTEGACPDLTASMLIEVYLGGHWVQGRVEFAGVYVAPLDDLRDGYYFIARDGSICGLCVGMKVRIQS